MEKEFLEEPQDIEEIGFLEEIKTSNLVILANNLGKDYEIGDFIVRAVDDVS